MSNTAHAKQEAGASRAMNTKEKPTKGLQFTRRFSKEGVHPFDEVPWEKRDAVITGGGGEVVFKQTGVEFPTTWTQQATNVVVSKYFRGKLGAPEREGSVKQMIGRVSRTMAAWGRSGGYFATERDASIFEDELTAILLQQRMAFNSPVWFNVGIEPHPQCSACFINSVEDSMKSIMELARTEALLFKGGSGAGSNLSAIRSSMEHLQGGGMASGPVSFMKGFDAFAGVIKSGGKTRRAAKMVILNVDHPDVEEFIHCKMNEEQKAHALIAAGYDNSLDGPAYGSVFFQNSNNSVRVTDEFMKAYLEGGNWQLRAVTTREVLREKAARDLMDEIAGAAHHCGDPGMQYDTTINDWHTCPNSGRINASNPCSEYMFLDDTACNLASLNLMKFYDFDTDCFDVEAYRHAVRVTITAMEIIVDNASYPTEKIAENSHQYRPLGIGYANLGSLLMAKGLAYDSDEARNVAGALTAVLTGESYAQSARIAADMGTFEGFTKNRAPMLRVMGKHRDAAHVISAAGVEPTLLQAAHDVWDDVVHLGEEYGFRNSQASVIAPTGTISFLMDCDTTGIEPDIALVKFKVLVGGGYMNMVNRTVPLGLRRLGYNDREVAEICDHLEKEATIEGAPHLKKEHLAVFDCAFKAKNGVRSIHAMGHLRMMSACQPFLSGAISKTVNMPEDASVEDIKQAYVEAWRMGLKAIAIYRDGSKKIQPLSTGKSDDKTETVAEAVAPAGPVRRKLPDERRALTHKFSVAGHDGYLHVGLYEDGHPGEIFIRMAKEGSTISGLMDAFATSVSIALQYGVPLDLLVHKFSHMRFEPSGMTLNPEIPFAKSITDYIFRYLASKFLGRESQQAVGIRMREPQGGEKSQGVHHEPLPMPMPFKLVEGAGASHAAAHRQGMHSSTFVNQLDAPGCNVCGTIMVRSGSCYTCPECGATSGCG